MELRAAQFGRITHVPWGEPVRVGRHMSRTIDLKKRGRDSCYFERPDSEEECLEEFEVGKAGEQAEPQSDKPGIDSKAGVLEDGADKDSDFIPMLDLKNDDDDDVDDFVCIKKVSRAKKTKSPDLSPEVEELPYVEDWLCTREGTSGRNKSWSTRGRQGRNKAVKKPQLDFVQDRCVQNRCERELAGKRSGLSVKAPNKTYGNRSSSSTRLVRSDSPIFLGEDEALSSHREDESSAKVTCPNQSAEKHSVCKTFTFKSSSSGKVEVSTEIEVLSADGDFGEVKGHEWPSVASHQPAIIAQEKSPTFSRSKTGSRLSLARVEKESLECTEPQAEKNDICCIETVPSSLPEGDEDILRSGEKRKHSQMDSKMNAKVDNIDNKKIRMGKKSASARYLKLTSSNKNTQQNEDDSTILNLAKATTLSGSSTMEAEIEKSDEDNVSFPSSAVFHSRKKRRSSNLFSESDESFNLGVSPVKAFPVIFEGSSDTPPSSSGHDVLTVSPTFGSKSKLPAAADNQRSVKVISSIFPDDEDDVYNATTEEDISTDKETRHTSDVQDVPQTQDDHQHSAIEDQRGQGSDGESSVKGDNNVNQGKPVSALYHCAEPVSAQRSC